VTIDGTMVLQKKSWETFKEDQKKYFSDGWDVMTEFFERRPQYVYQFMENTYGKYK